MGIVMRKLEIEPWTYEDYLEATDRSDNLISRKRWLEVVAGVRVKFKKYIGEEVRQCIREVDADLD